MSEKISLHDRPPEDDDDVTSIGRSMSRMRLLIGRRFIGRLAVRKMGAGLELSHIDVIGIVRRLGQTQEVTVGAIAEQMHIDPSRGSRVVADLVRRGVLQRQASQEDARRTVVALTPQGFQLLAEMEEIKMDAIASILTGWPEDDLAAFARLYDRFVASFEQRYQQFEAEIGAEPLEAGGKPD